MSAAFHRYAWGLLLVILDFRLQNFDVLPDVVGYGLVWSALLQLNQVKAGYRKAVPWAGLLTVLSIHELVPIAGMPEQGTGISISWFVYQSVTVILGLLLNQTFLRQMTQHALDLSAHSFATTVDRGRRFVVFSYAAMLIFLPFTINLSPNLLQGGTIVLAVISIIAMLLLFLLCRDAARALNRTTPDH
ncbi:hypothetical protein [Paenibacillus koleovorans]|uniref:hypothetical protein n=1 Tax=Paenibacillus koleovorans TaxID=121608 RepID=UPI000FDC8ED8|nr:hypothetical protein [Paenibacillus koleovorans]